ncbi:MAG: transglutaminase domain protein [Chloroflexi bacterium]|nr:transglutaminase domain protein [Chloroflexota bacterium]
MIIETIHITRFTYDAPVVESTMEIRLAPLSDVHQRVLEFELLVDPASRTFSFTDGFQNLVYCCNVLDAHDTLTLKTRSRVQTLLANPFERPAHGPAPLEAVDAWPYLQFRGPVDAGPGLEQLGREFTPSSEDVLGSLMALMLAIHTDFEYQPDATTVSSTVSDVLQLKQGVCQDFAHLMIAACRHMKLPARYVSGYLVRSPGHENRGAEASHAWCEVWLPDLGWLGFDPTNNLVAADSHVRVGIGRDYTDVPPTRGIHRGLAEEQVEVSVTTKRIDATIHSGPVLA